MQELRCHSQISSPLALAPHRRTQLHGGGPEGRPLNRHTVCILFFVWEDMFTLRDIAKESYRRGLIMHIISSNFLKAEFGEIILCIFPPSQIFMYYPTSPERS